MDNLAHTLVGAALGRAVAGHRVPRAAVLGAIAANAPDWAELFTGYPWPGAQYLAQHRGITHSLLGVAVETLFVTLVASVLARWWERRRRLPPTPTGWILACVAATVLSHPIMDWQGSYGLRPFLPWSDRWYYGDFVAIVDPLYWLAPLAALAWGASRGWKEGVAALATSLVIGYLLVRGRTLVAPWLLGACALTFGVAGLGWMLNWFGPPGARRAATAALTFLVAYAVAQGIVSFAGRTAVRLEATARFGPDASWAAMTVVGHPFTWEAIYADRDSVAGAGWVSARHLDLPAVRRALAESADGRAIARFARFLAAEVDSSGPRVRVYLRDARYQPVGRNGWATVAVTLE